MLWAMVNYSKKLDLSWRQQGLNSGPATKSDSTPQSVRLDQFEWNYRIMASLGYGQCKLVSWTWKTQ
jgi:hypothetical protein